MAKHILRKKLSLVSTNDENDLQIIEKAQNFISKYRPKIVGIYLSRKNEVDLLPIALQSHNLIFAAPKIRNDEILFTTYYPGAPIQPNEQYPKYFEPVSDVVVIPNLIFIPGIAFDLKGYRLGMGKGHYDKYLTNHKAIKIGVCRKANLVTRLQNEIHDIRMDHIITEDIILNCYNQGN